MDSPVSTSGIDEFNAILSAQINDIDASGLSDQQISALNVICGSELLLAALELLDLKAVSKLNLPNGQPIYEIAGNMGIYQVQLGVTHSCNCKPFVESVILKAEQPICAHLLAARMADRLGLADVQDIGIEKLISLFGLA
ncbi:hypothetical protein O181_058688 [Austropuccinia psidii MF-1]|uniref:SWIM-type domain-containing protein n=1 Tax=Austropuccinia psidii MF-1 TaxID=1389203 RepID=A0A9Q3EDI1_9BASI|nr:hypothetical protein [Austropuccinia psidii MF-1]